MHLGWNGGFTGDASLITFATNEHIVRTCSLTRVPRLQTYFCCPVGSPYLLV